MGRHAWDLAPCPEVIASWLVADPFQPYLKSLSQFSRQKFLRTSPVAEEQAIAMKASRAVYDGNCVCRYNRDKAGGARVLRYPNDVQ